MTKLKLAGTVFLVFWAAYATYRLEELRHFWIAYYCGAAGQKGFMLGGDFMEYSCPRPVYYE